MTDEDDSPDTLEGRFESESDEELKGDVEDEYERDDGPEKLEAEITCIGVSC